MAESKQIRKAVELEVARKLEQRAKTWLAAAKEQGGASSTTRVVVNELLAVADRLAGKRARKINTRVEEPAPEPVVIEGATLFNADNIHVLRSLPSCSVDALVLDPPSGIAFMSKQWDRDKGGRDGWVGWFAEVMTECYRVMKPGAHAFVWALPRTSHWTSLAIEQAEFEIRDIVVHVYGTGFPKSTSVSVQLDKNAGAMGHRGKAHYGHATGHTVDGYKEMSKPQVMPEHRGITEEARKWAGWGTALKPATEHWILARKPLIGTIAENIRVHGTGALNIDGCRVGTSKRVPSSFSDKSPQGAFSSGHPDNPGKDPNVGRWPPNILLTHAVACSDTCVDDECPVAVIDAQSGVSVSPTSYVRSTPAASADVYGRGAIGEPAGHLSMNYGDTGGASRYFPLFRYSIKPSTRERNIGCADVDGNHHPTLKGIELMRWLVRLITPPGGLVLDCFMGSGTTGIAATLEGARFIGIERELEYFEVACARIEHHTKENT